ncbi:MAG: hypothetical protein K2W95_02190 [Candidatus Obscuribacterales bacterium]|nr:hypothetical protein [Candidatus Obscuribacterales bacterium]
MRNELEEIMHLAESAVTPISGVTVVDAKWIFQGGRRTLEITIHRPAARVSLDDCEQVSRLLEKALDEADPPVVDGAYLLEVQSPGLERELKTEREFAAFIGEKVEVKTREQHESLGWSFVGRLAGRDRTTITIEQPQPLVIPAKGKKKRPDVVPPVASPETVTLKVEQVAKVKLHPQFQ